MKLFRCMRGTHVVANAVVIVTLLVAAVLHSFNKDLYDVVVQEDEILEWASFWGFFFASLIFGYNANQKIRIDRLFPWFTIGLSLFCFVVAMEEISWGQRVFGYGAPTYFLEENYQQEFNVHNVLDTGIRQIVMHAVLLGYGVVLSAASMNLTMRNLLQRLRIVAPSPQLMVSFVTISVVYAWYPWDQTGEWVELVTGYCFAFAALLDEDAVKPNRGIIGVVSLLVAIWIAAFLTFFGLRAFQSGDPERIATATQEIDALARDFDGPNLHTRCNIHKRLYTFAREYGQTYLFAGEFSQLARQSGAAKRAEFALDPWNSAYWVMHRCSNDREIRLIYSFGPNRRRDSTDWALGGDDIGLYLPNK